MILYDIIWYYMVFYDILWYYLILYDDILRASLSEENCTMEFPAKTFVRVISLCSFSAGCWVTAPSLDTWIHIICNLLIFMTALVLHWHIHAQVWCKWPLSPLNKITNVRVASIKDNSLPPFLCDWSHGQLGGKSHTLAHRTLMSRRCLQYLSCTCISVSVQHVYMIIYAMWMYNYYCIVCYLILLFVSALNQNFAPWNPT